MKLNQGKMSILCVDDEELILKSLRRQLRSIDTQCHIELAQSSKVALQLLARYHEQGRPFALLIVDHLMPEMNGDELLKQATQMSPQTYQVMLTGQIDGFTIGALINHAKLFRFLAKPWSIEELTVVVKSALSSFQRDMDLLKQQQANARLTRQLHQAQKMEILGNLSGEIAHDFNNLLHVVMLSAESIQENLKHAPLDHNISTAVHDIMAACNQAGKLSTQLLSLSKQSDDLKVVFDLSLSIRPTITLLKRLIPSRIKLHYTPCSSPLMLYGNENALQQVLMNLVINAKDAIKELGNIHVTLTSHQQPQTQDLLVGQLHVHTYARLRVADTGLGIAQPMLHQIFEPFFSSKGDQGTGLGLAIVYNTIVRHLGGAIDVSCDEQTLFDIYIPLSEVNS